MAKVFGGVARDDAGATHLAGMLADRGMRPILILDEPWREDFARWTRDADAVVIATASRFGKSDAAYEETRRAIRLLETFNPPLLHVNYSSALYSTNVDIGSSIDAAMDETHQEFTVALPDVSAGTHHMNPDDMVAHLQGQTKRRVGRVSPSNVEQGVTSIRQHLARLREAGVEIAMLDFASERDLQNICEAISELRLITGSSALAKHLPMSWVPSKPVYPRRGRGGRGFLVVADSDSPVTHSQNAWLAARDAVTIALDSMNLASGVIPDSVLTPICEELASGGTCLLQTSGNPHTLHEYLHQQNKSESEARESIARSLATFVRDVMSLITPQGLIVAGAHTATILSRVLGFGALAVGPSIEPGIPVCATLSGSALPVVLKPGNAGSESFYGQAIETIRGLESVNGAAGQSA